MDEGTVTESSRLIAETIECATALREAQDAWDHGNGGVRTYDRLETMERQMREHGSEYAPALAEMLRVAMNYIGGDETKHADQCRAEVEEIARKAYADRM